MYCVLIGNIKGSRHLEDRAKIQKLLAETLRGVNARFSEQIASDFSILMGDSFQGVLKDASVLLELIDLIEWKMYPVLIRFGIGFGEIITDLRKESSADADGPAFYRARMMIDTLRKEEKRKKAQIISMMLCSDETGFDKQDERINASFALIALIKRDWSEREREFMLQIETSGLSQAETAERLGIRQSSVQKGLERAGYYTYVHVRDILQEQLAEILFRLYG